ncbi:ABC transporter permease subunit [Aeromicrobium sp. 636]|uniref:ABC transporter permease subunit n=1 Tax=Aeromicrobium senzhongii TaxID=2663859 RepID=A0A8I0EUA8_9ACTN|nr:MULTISPECIES: ABC transporter permease subunit [Aeromicrobium]MBC9225679.1 ABC transporter permease subunit [Aeromicrobium senzhongii]MCQ3997789.1 ABC transporter permease subunit [Aeromicrobium sp. 636]
MASESRTRTVLTGSIGLGAIVLVWAVAAATVFADKAIPTPWGVITGFADDGFEFYRSNFTGTVTEAAIGFFWGNLIALALAAVVLLVPVFEKVVTQIAVISYCVPIVAVVPILYIVLGPPEAPTDPSPTAVVLAGVSVFFTTVVGAVLGFRSTDPTSLDVVSVYGGGRWKQMTKVQLMSAVPAIISALQVAAPAAFLGAILGEYIGGLDRGVGPALVNAQQSLDVERAWGIMFVCALVAGLAYATLGLVGRIFASWSAGTSIPGSSWLRGGTA